MSAQPSAVRVAVIGAGSWGTALASLASAQAPTLLWARAPALAHEINSTHSNTKYLPAISLPSSLTATSSLEQAVSHACSHPDSHGLIILGVPVAGLSAVCADLAGILVTARSKTTSVVWTCKGFEHATGQLPHEIAQAAFAPIPQLGLGVLSGPSFAHEVARGLPVALTIATQSTFTTLATTTALHGLNARIYSSDDIAGVETGGALKNIIAIACGISDGLGLGTNARAALITRGLAEMQRLGIALGGQAETFSGLTGLGDLVLTATGDLSRNRQVGLAIGQGKTLAEVLAGGVTAEGVRCARAALVLGRRHNVELPITEAVCKVLFDGLAPEQAVSGLLAREARAEYSHAVR